MTDVLRFHDADYDGTSYTVTADEYCADAECTLPHPYTLTIGARVAGESENTG